MSWILLSVCSALLLGVYDLAKKHALNGNAVSPVLFGGILTSALVWAPIVIWSAYAPASFPWQNFIVQPLELAGHGLLFFKSSLVGTSWILGYFALKHLPISIAGPIRATSPLWTILLAVGLMGEMPTFWQWIGIIVVMIAFYSFSFVGKLEGIHFSRNKWVAFMIGATLLGACSALYDKYLFQTQEMDPATVQAWFSIYLVVVMLPVCLLWDYRASGKGHFEWRWSIPLIGIFLLFADFLYFTAISQEGALISVISPIRRTSVVVTFIGGIVLHREQNFRAKSICILILLGGVILLNVKAA